MRQSNEHFCQDKSALPSLNGKDAQSCSPRPMPRATRFHVNTSVEPIMRCPVLNELSPPSPGKTGWPWTIESPQLLDSTPDGTPWPRISIVTPSYNQGQFIEETIRSVLLQGYPNLEYIVIDGGSTDESLNVIKKYAHWLHYWVSEPDGGQSHAINKGLMYCTGDIFNWINSDDLLTPGALHAVAMAWRKSPNLIVAGRVINFEPDGSENLIIPNALTLENFANIRKARENALNWHQPGTFLPRDEISKIGGVREDLRFTMDHILMIQLLRRYGVVYIPDILAIFRIHSGSKTFLSLGFLKFHLERLKALSTMQWLQRYLPTKELKQQQVSFLLKYADLERHNRLYRSAFQRYKEALTVSPSLTIVILIRQSFLGRIIRKIKKGAVNFRKEFTASNK